MFKQGIQFHRLFWQHLLGEEVRGKEMPRRGLASLLTKQRRTKLTTSGQHSVETVKEEKLLKKGVRSNKYLRTLILPTLYSFNCASKCKEK